MEGFRQLFVFLKTGIGIPEDFFKGDTARLGILILIVIVSFYVGRFLVAKVFNRFIKKTSTTYDDYLLTHKVLDKSVHLIPSIVAIVLVPVLLEDKTLSILLGKIVFIWFALACANTISALSRTAADIIATFPAAKDKPIKTHFQVLNLLVWIVAVLIVISKLIDQSPLVLLSGLGALTAVLMLVFKDTILGFVASIQISAYDLIRVGDWIEFPKYGADGDVIDISLNVIKIQNFDKTITIIPTHVFLSEAYKNWRGVKELGSRRIKRAVNIDIATIKFCTEEMLKRFRRIEFISEYIDRKMVEIEEYNKKHNISDEIEVNGRRLTNIGTFRAYIEEYLKRHPKINKNLTFLVRQLSPSQYGLPIEVYCFTSDYDWKTYEGVVADIFDHILAVVPYFDLSVFQIPTGRDLRLGLKNMEALRF